MPDDEKQPGSETQPTPAVTPETFDKWLETQPESVRKQYEAHTSGMKSALDAERAKAKEAAKQLKRLEVLEAEEQKRKEAEMSEMDKLKAKNDQLQAQLREREITDLKRTIAAEVGLPDTLAVRLQGADEAALRADAEQLKAALPAQDEQEKPKPKPKITPTNPGSGREVGETREQKMSRIYGGGGDPLDPTWAAQHGGGVVFSPGKE